MFSTLAATFRKAKRGMTRKAIAKQKVVGTLPELAIQHNTLHGP